MDTSSQLVTALENAWESIQRYHSDVPSVIVAVASRGRASGGYAKVGHFAAEAWLQGDEPIHELFIAGEGLARGAAETFGTLLHEAAHGVARARGVVDTTRQGRYHNGEFRTIAESLGLTVTRDSTIGWSFTSLTAATAERYSTGITRLNAAITAYRREDGPALGSRSSSNNGVRIECPGCGNGWRGSLKAVDLGLPACVSCEVQYRVVG